MIKIFLHFILLWLITSVHAISEHELQGDCSDTRDNSVECHEAPEGSCSLSANIWKTCSKGAIESAKALGISKSNLKLPDIKVPDIKIPDVKFPNFKPGDNATDAGKLEFDDTYYKNVKNTPLTDQEQPGNCYDELGCFPNKFPWFSVLRPFPLPLEPKRIDTKIYLYTTNKPKERFTVPLWKSVSLDGSDFNPNRAYTVFITHGFASSGNVSWVADMKDAYLKLREANVFLVDWGKGASHWNYLQVAANTRVVGAELKRFAQYLVEKKRLDPARIHMIGHSLGAHVSSYMAKGIPGVGQLTALDPAQPGFEYCSDEVRLKKTDALYVEAIHTNTRPVIPLLGFGLMLPTGHNDYYMNGGLIQPGCKSPPIDQIKLNGILDLGKYSVEVISEWVACSHGRSYQFYTESLQNDFCTFWGRSAGLLTTLVDVASLGKSEKFLQKFNECTLSSCSPIGLESKEYPARGTFLVSSHSRSPYCQSDPKITSSMKQQRAVQEENAKKGITEKNDLNLGKIIGKVI